MLLRLVASIFALIGSGLAGSTALQAASLSDSTITTASVGVASVPGPWPSAHSNCDPIASPPASLQTASKYEQSIRSKSVVDPVSAQLRREALSPIDASIHRLESLARMASLDTSQSQLGSCVVQTLQAWARAGALTEMKTEDANLTRDRLMVSISSVLASLPANDQDRFGQSEGGRWLRAIAVQTMRFYDLEAGPKSRRNNHRYWAGLSVAQAGLLLHEPQMLAWGRTSLELGLCQVDAEGFLPLELERAAKAFDYHLYAYIALRSLDGVIVPMGAVTCGDGLRRLEDRVREGLQSPMVFEKRTGLRQDEPSRTNLLRAKRLIEARPFDLRASTAF